jgi:hypothetical protein
MKQTINYLQRQKVPVTESLINSMVNDVFEIFADLPQTANRQDVRKLIVNKINWDCKKLNFTKNS